MLVPLVPIAQSRNTNYLHSADVSNHQDTRDGHLLQSPLHLAWEGAQFPLMENVGKGPGHRCVCLGKLEERVEGDAFCLGMGWKTLQGTVGFFGGGHVKAGNSGPSQGYEYQKMACLQNGGPQEGGPRGIYDRKDTEKASQLPHWLPLLCSLPAALIWATL